MTDTDAALTEFMEAHDARNPGEPEFRQAVEDVARSVMPWYVTQDRMRRRQVLERLTEPDRTVSFRVPWEADDGSVRFNRGWRVQFSQVMGPYKGGLRFAPSVNQSVLKFLGFEQIFKNTLTGLPMGGAKGGADFDPKEASEAELRRFCHAFMDELYRHIGPDVDVPAGDMGVGMDEISLMFGRYLTLKNTWHGALTGKGSTFGGSAVRTEATGYGCVYFAELMLERLDRSIEDARVAISGSGNVALYAAEKALDEGATVVTLSDSGGTLVFEDGLDRDTLETVKTRKGDGARLSELADETGGSYRDGDAPWGEQCDIALPCATQNEMDGDAAKALADNGVWLVCEGANMPLTSDAAQALRDAGIPRGPGKASNAGGVAVSGLEESQNAQRLYWSRDEVDRQLRDIMRGIHDDCLEVADGHADDMDYVTCANLAAFQRVSRALDAFWVF